MIIAISGKIGSGKDIIGKIIQSLTYKDREEKIIEVVTKNYINNNISDWQIKKFADKLKDIVCLLIGCTREQLEDQDFKNKELGKEWWYYKLPNNSLISYLDDKQPDFIKKYILIKLTPRKLLQLLGTDCGRDIIHPNIWINSLFSDYNCSHVKVGNFEKPNWIITDLRFPNELKAVKDRNGITIKVNRNINKEDDLTQSLAFAMMFKAKQEQTVVFHPSETALDNAEFDYTINNNGTIEKLIEEVKKILIKEKII